MNYFFVEWVLLLNVYRSRTQFNSFEIPPVRNYVVFSIAQGDNTIGLFFFLPKPFSLKIFCWPIYVETYDILMNYTKVLFWLSKRMHKLSNEMHDIKETGRFFLLLVKMREALCRRCRLLQRLLLSVSYFPRPGQVEKCRNS